MQVQSAHGQTFTLLNSFAGGGEAKIWSVRDQANLVAKIYHRPDAEREQKIRAMLANPPRQPSTHLAIAWPTDLLYVNRRFVGFLMPNVQGNAPIVDFYNPLRRKQRHAGFTWHYLHRTALNLAIAATEIHARGHVIGDVNESNILVNLQALVTLVDTDSFQIRGERGALHRCLVGKPEYTPPELFGANFQQIERGVEHDHFGLAVLFFHLLMEGVHPFAGALRTPNPAVSRTDLYCIQQGIFPYDTNGLAQPPPAAPPFTMLHPEIQQLFLDCFVAGHRQPRRRPSIQQWQQILEQTERELCSCAANPGHVYSNHLAECPWCRREAGPPAPGQSAPALQQRPLPPANPAATPVISVPAPAAKPRRVRWRTRFRPPIVLSKRTGQQAVRRWRQFQRDVRKLPTQAALARRRLASRFLALRMTTAAMFKRRSVQRTLLVGALAGVKLGLQFSLPAGDQIWAIALGGLALLPTVIGALIGGLWIGLAVGGISAVIDFFPGEDWRALCVLLIPALLSALAAHLTPQWARRFRPAVVWLLSGAISSVVFWLGVGLVFLYFYGTYPFLRASVNLLLRTFTLAVATWLVMATWRRFRE